MTLESRFVCWSIATVLTLACSGGGGSDARAQDGGTRTSDSTSTSPVSANPNARALLIGINDYAAVPDLAGTHSDIRRMQAVLESKFGFVEFTVLRDQEATREAILAAFREVARKAKPSDQIYIHFSGHGSRVKDQSGDEEDGFDESLLAYDSRKPGVPDILDDEIYEIFKDIEAGSIVVVTDACHSGGQFRDPGKYVPVRQVAPDTRLELYASTTRAVVQIEEYQRVPWLLFTGAAADEKALDVPIDGEPYGLFSYAFARSLERLGADAKATDVMAALKSEIARHENVCAAKCPEPQLEGTSEQIAAPLFVRAAAAPAAAPAAAFALVSRGTDGVVVLRNAAGMGAKPNDAWAVYPPGETKFAPDGAVGRVVVQTVSGASAYALGASGFTPPADARAIPLRSFRPSGETTVRISAADAAANKQLADAIRSALGSAISIVGEGIANLTAECTATGACTLRGPGGDTIDQVQRADLAARVAREVRRNTALAKLAALDPASPGIDLEMSVVGAPVSTGPSASTGAAASAGTAGSRGVVQKLVNTRRRLVIRPDPPFTEENALQLRFVANQDCYLTAAAVDEAGATDLLFPAPGQDWSGRPDLRIKAGETVTIPDAIGGGSQGFVITFVEPAGRATIHATCTADKADADRIRQALQAMPRDPLADAPAYVALRDALAERPPVGAAPAPTSSRGVVAIPVSRRTRSVGARVQLFIEPGGASTTRPDCPNGSRSGERC